MEQRRRLTASSKHYVYAVCSVCGKTRSILNENEEVDFISRNVRKILCSGQVIGHDADIAGLLMKQQPVQLAFFLLLMRLKPILIKLNDINK